MAVDADPTGQLSELACDESHTEDTSAHDVDDGDTETDIENDVDVIDDIGARTELRWALTAGLAIVVALAGLGGWLGYRAYESLHAQQQRQVFLEVGRQSALNLTTIDYTKADADVQRIIDSSTGTFRDDFQQRSGPFIDVVKQAQSKSEGTIVDAALESQDGDEAQVLVAVDVNTSVAGSPEPTPRSWRMRMTVQKSGSEAKVSNVEFVQ